MRIARHTMSLCPECLAEIPAQVIISNNDVRIIKTCPEHGVSEGTIEKDPIFYMLCAQFNADNIYNGLFVDATNKCNSTCKYCYHDTSGTEPTFESILLQCAENANLAPFILVGGEPTTREDLPELLWAIRHIGPVLISTNGIKLADLDYVKSLDALAWPGVFNASISLHPEASNLPGDYAKKIEGIENVLSLHDQLFGLIFVIDSLDQIDEAIEINRRYAGRICETRLKIVSSVSQTENGSGLFTSEVYQYLYDKALDEGVSFSINHDACNKVVYFNMIYDGIKMTAVKWFTRQNVDLVEINCGPWHKNKDGRFLNMGHSLILGG
jgi:uncharacterized radical SAM superfamily Fe-S cluster-containing enzyme